MAPGRCATPAVYTTLSWSEKGSSRLDRFGRGKRMRRAESTLPSNASFLPSSLAHGLILQARRRVSAPFPGIHPDEGFNARLPSPS